MRTALITGISRGIGRAVALKFLNNNYYVIGTSTTGKVSFDHKNLTVFKLNLASKESIESASKEIEKFGNKIDILINNAGIVVEDEANLGSISIDYLRQTLEVNLIGTIDFTEKILPLINKDSYIFNISSRAGSLTGEIYRLNYPSYKISKVGINMFTQILADRLKDFATVSSINPGWVKTDMGGDDAEDEPEVVANDIYKLANLKIDTGKFWFKGYEYPW